MPLERDGPNGPAEKALLQLTGWLPTSCARRRIPQGIVGPSGLRSVAAGLEAAYAADIDIRVKGQALPRSAATLEATEFSEAV